MKINIAFFLLCWMANIAIAQSPIGTWKTIDDETGEEKSHVEIYEKDGKLFGKITKLLNASSTTCSNCSGDRQGKPLVDLVILWDMEKKGDVWKGGKIFSPTKDKEYRCKIWFDDGKGAALKVRGYYFGFFRTQTWFRVS